MRRGTLSAPQELLTALETVPFRPTFFEVSGHQIPYMRLEVPLDPIDPLIWLNFQTSQTKIYWENPQENLKIAGIGAAYELKEIPSFSQDGGPRFFGGQDFYQRKTTSWDDIPSSRYILPLLELKEEKNITTLCINLTSELDLKKILKNLHFDLPSFEDELPKPLGRLDSPSYPIWERHIKESLQQIALGEMQKIVLARCTLFDFENLLNPYLILRKLQGLSNTATLFAFEFEPGSAFIGASPETLYRRQGNTIKSAAVAGTRPRGKTAEEDQTLQEELLENTKELHEFNVVKETIDNILSPLCISLEKTPENRILQTSTVQHLIHVFQGKLQAGVSDSDLVRALHPTPAVGGLPRKKALEEIRKRENFDRGWYAAPVGWVSANEAHKVVAIRSALVTGSALRLFAGTGIVQGSSPHREWEELEQKISQFILW